jgi:hypothetical protein
VTINDTRRSAGYVVEHAVEGLCDNTLHAGWFRFVSAAGGAMPTSCVQQYHVSSLKSGPPLTAYGS